MKAVKSFSGKVLCLYFLLLTGWAQAGEEPEPLAKVVFEQSWYDFGEVKAGDILRHTFHFKVENAPVHISRVITGCGCTSASLEKERYIAGESGKIILELDTADFSGLTYKEIFVELVGAEKERVELALTAQVL